MSLPSRLVTGALLVLLVFAAGCGRQLQQSLGLRNQPPVVQLESTFAPTGDDQALDARLTWRGYDPDGRIDHFLVTEDVTAYDRASGWTVSGAQQKELSWRRATRGAAAPVRPEAAIRFFAVKAVDDRGEVSQPAYRAFFQDDIAPTVTIVHPTPSPLVTPTIPPDVIITWIGSDPDGSNGRPAKYKFKLFRRGNPGVDWNTWLANPDSLRSTFAPTFAGWDSISGDSTQVHYSGLVPQSEYLFVITALDAEGAYDPVFSLSKNMLRLFVATNGFTGPLLTFFNSTFTYTYVFGAMPDSLPASWIVPIQAPAGQPLTIDWRARTSLGSAVAGYRWALDIADFHDETARRNRNDVRHWSVWDPASTSLTIDQPMLSKLPVADSHRLFVEAVDDLGWRSLGVVEFRFVTSIFDRDLLIVDDTRLKVDQRVAGSPDSLRPPTGIWPTAAELDTFLYAVGGARWQMNPSGTLSAPGIFQGYRFDTLGTRLGLENPEIPAALLQHYRHVVWLTDVQGADNTLPGTSTISPITALRSMCSPNRQNPLAEWVTAGGKLWALGGGFGQATNAPWNRTGNDGVARTYSSFGDNPDLAPGRFMYDLAHWRSEFRVVAYTGNPLLNRAPGADAMLPASLRPKLGLDPIPPYRTSGDFYGTLARRGLEYLDKPNAILEDQNPSPVRTDDVAMLDTLMMVSGANLPGLDPGGPTSFPAMTVYHGADCGPVVFSGFDLWSWARADCRQLVDAVLQGRWGLVREAPVASAAARARGNTPRR